MPIMQAIRRWTPTAIFLILGIVGAYILMNKEWAQMQWEIPGRPSEYPFAQQMRPYLIAVACFLPFVISIIYQCADIMDRYVSRLWMEAFFMCTAILITIFILGDFAENVNDLMDLPNPVLSSLRFYLAQMPMIMNLILPYTLLMGTLWCLSKLSAGSEITGMLQSGKSLLRINLPILIGSSFVALYFGIFGFHWAPNATLYRTLLFDSISAQSNKDAPPRGSVFKNDTQKRIWRIGEPAYIDNPGRPIKNVHIEQFSAPGKLEYELIAKEASWNAESRMWSFKDAVKRVHHDLRDQDLTKIPTFETVPTGNCELPFEETPWQIIAPTTKTESYGTPDLLETLKTDTNAKIRRMMRTEWHVRIAKVFSCIILTFIAIPSAITFQRRSPMAGIGIAIFLAAFMLFLYEFFPTMASAGYLPPWLGAWMPNILYLIIGIKLFQSKLAHRSILEATQSWLKHRHEHKS